ncbi:MAG: hypothetical protein J6P72_10390 [Firmicutes bacterium]|nr:hypothetical protein [Bacillota bacterium]
MKKRFCMILAITLILGLVISGFEPKKVSADETSGARTYLQATSGGHISWKEMSGSGADRIGTVEAGSTFELSGSYGVAAGGQVELQAIPDEGKMFYGWYTKWNSTAPELFSTSSQITYTLPYDVGQELTAVFEMPTPAVTNVESVDVAVALPKAGESGISAASLVSVGTGVYVESAYWGDGAAIGSDYTDPAQIDPGTFMPGGTYYMVITLRPQSGYRLLQGGELGSGSDPTRLNVSGATSTYEFLMVTNYTISETEYGQYGMAYVTLQLPEAEKTGTVDVFIDNTTDASVSYVTGSVYLTGGGGTEAGYNPAKTIYTNQASVTYSKPLTAEVQGMLDQAYTEIYNLANVCKESYGNGEFHMSQSTSTGKVWDLRKYESTYTVYLDGTEQSFSVVYDHKDADSTRWYKRSDTGEMISDAVYYVLVTHIASGEYGKETFYRVEANGWVGVTYTNSKGDGETWQQGSGKALELVFNRSGNDQTAFDHFTGLQIDDAPVDSASYTAKSGSVIIELAPEYLETLSVGKHSLTALFDDADDVQISFTIKQSEESSTPAEESSAPTEESSVPAEESSAQAEESSAPTEESSAPTEESSAPAEESSAPIGESSMPAEESSQAAAPVESSAADTGSTNASSSASNAESKSEQSSSTPKTGDSTNLVLWITLLLASITALAATWIKKQRI